jgi:uncharacterized membrane protein YkvA (DUF1232 family)
MPGQHSWGEVLLGAAIALLAVYVLLLVGLWFYALRHPESVSLRDALKTLPDLGRTLWRMVRDPAVPRRAKVLLWGLAVYLALPIDLVPDFLPVIGYADDVIIVVWVLRTVVRWCGAELFRAHWPGSDTGRAVVERLAGLRE